MKPITNEESDKIPRDIIDKMSVESEENVLMLLNSSEDFIFVLDREGNIININTSVLKALKYSKKELLRMNVLDLHAPEQRNEAKSVIRELIKGNRKSLTAPFVTKDNKHIYIEAILTRGWWKNQNVFIGICRDITERKRIERLLDESDDKLISLLEYSSDLFAIVNEKFEYEYINEEVYQEVLGYSKEELLGKARIDIIHPDDLKNAMEEARVGFKTGEYKSIIRIKTKEGKWLWIESKGKTFVDKEGNTKAFLIGRDITERKIAEQRLAESEKEFRNLITHLSDVIVEIDNEGEITFMSPQCFEIFGYRPEELIGKNYSKYVHPKDLPMIANNIRESLNSEKSVSFEYRGRHKDGKYVKISVKGNRVISEDKIRYVGVLRDNTEQIKAEQKLKEIEEDKKRFKKISQIEPEVRFWKLIQPKKDVSVVQKTRQMLETVLDNIPISIYWIDLDLKFIGCNENFANLVQIKTPNHIIGKLSKDIPYIAENSQLINEHESKIIKNGLPEYNSIESWKLGNNRDLWFNVNRIPLFDDELNVIGVLVTLNDITAKKIAEQRLKESEAKYRILFDHSPIGIGLSDIDGNIIASNEKMREITGYSEEELKKINLSNTYVDLNDRKELRKKVWSSQMIRGFETKLKKKDGSVYSARLNIDLLNLENNDIFLTICEDITERKAIELELEKSEREISTLLNNIPDVIITVDHDRRIQFVNHMPTSVPKEEIIGQDIYSFLEHEHQDVLKDTFKRVFSTGIHETIDLLGFTNLWYKARFIPIKNKEEQISVILIATNITDTKITTEKLKTTEDRLTSILDSSGDLFAIVDDKFKYEYINEEAYKKTLGYTNEDLLGKQRLDIMHPEDLESAMKAGLFQKLTQKEVIDYELRIKSKKGDWVNVESRGQSFVDADGKTKIFLIGRDITFRKQAEQKIKNSEEKYRHLFENSPNAIVLMSLKGIVVDCNPATIELFGYQKEELLHKNFLDIAAYSPDLIPQFKKRFSRIIVQDKVVPLEFQVNKKDGTPFWITSHIALNNLGQETFVQAIIQDITEKKKSEEIIQKEIEKLKEIDQLRNDLMNRISHELKTPLTSIYSTSQHLLENYSEQFENRVLQLIRTIHKGGNRLKSLAENLVNSLRLESRELMLNLQKEDIIDLIQESIESFTILAQERKIFLKKELPENVMLVVDKIWLSQAISNLISNAIKNTPERGGVLIKLLESSNYIDIIVEDTGVGLTKKEKEKLFTKFGKIERFNEDLDIDIEGSGLGLFISKEIVHLHDGELLVDSRGRNQGSIFTIRLKKNKKDS